MPPKGRRTKKGSEADQEVMDNGLPVLPVAGVEAKDKFAAVDGPFEDLSDLQTIVDQGKQSGTDEPDTEGNAADQEPTESKEEAAAEGEADDDDAPSEMAPEDQEDGYLSDDSDEHLELDSLNSVIALKRFSLTLLVPFARKAEVTRAAVTIAALLDDWKDQLSPDALQMTTYQELSSMHLSRKHFGRLQVTFNHVRDANFVWKQVINHECLNGDCISLTWQYPEDARFLRERILNPTAKEVLLKGVPAELTAELIRRLLVVSNLVKRGRSAFASGFGFHRTIDPVTGLDTDMIRGLVVPHVADEYRWRYFVEEPTSGKRYLLHYPSLTCDYCGGQHMSRYHDHYITTVCEKAQGNRFEQATAHIASARHKGGMRKEGSATRANKHSQKLLAFKKEFITKQAK
ncbi:unnamed protein product [Closterium sp. Yama58-4]|nr:unnamed protein product [Closterium sp. Yama58-4]